MPLAKDQLEAIEKYVDELGLEGDARTNLIATITGNEKAAVQFIGQRFRHMDYTKKTQELADQRKSLEDKEKAVAATVQEYAQQAQAANEKAAKVIKDLEAAKITASTAAARIEAIKETYNLTDEELPSVTPAGGVVPPKESKADGSFDKEAFAKELRASIIKDIIPELGGMMRAPSLMADIADEHKQLTGKRLTAADFDALIKKSSEGQISLQTAWEREYKIPELRQDEWRKAETAKIQQKLEDDWRQKQSEMALDTVKGRRNGPNQLEDSTSPVVGRQYESRAGEEVSNGHGTGNPPANPKPNVLPVQRQSGAEKAAAKWIERSQAGLIGKPLAPTKVA